MPAGRLGVLAGLFALALAARLGLTPPPPRPVGRLELPVRLGAWVGRDLPVAASAWESMPGGQLLFREYRRGQARIFLTLVRSEQPGAFHRPLFCYQGEGWSVVSAGVRRLPGGGPAYTLLAQRGEVRELMLYWYTCAGRPVAGRSRQQLAMLGERLHGRPGRGGMVRVAAPCGSSPAPAEAMVGAFLEGAKPALEAALR